MLHNKLVLTFSLLLVLSHQSFGQAIGLSLQPAFACARLPRGVAVVYPGPPLWAGDLMVAEKNVPGFAGDLFTERHTRWSRLIYQASIGYTSLGALQTFDYDYAASVNNVVSIEKRYQYLGTGLHGHLTWPVRTKAQILIGAGLHIDYLIGSEETSRNYVGGSISETKLNRISEENRFNYGPRASAGVRWKGWGVSFFYKSYIKAHVDHENKRVLMYGLDVSYILRKAEAAQIEH